MNQEYVYKIILLTSEFFLEDYMWFTNKKLNFVVVQHNKENNRYTPRARFEERREAEWYCKNVLRSFIELNDHSVAIRLIDTYSKQEIDLWGEFEPTVNNKKLVELLTICGKYA